MTCDEILGEKPMVSCGSPVDEEEFPITGTSQCNIMKSYNHPPSVYLYIVIILYSEFQYIWVGLKVQILA